MEFFYINHNYKLINTYFYDSKTDLYTYFESANYKRIKKGLNLNYNFYYPIYKKLYIMSKIGIGVKERKVSIYNLDETKFQTYENLKEYFLVPELGINYYRTNIGTDKNFNLNLDLKIVYKF